MTLTTRLLVFFISMLALVLVGFSVAAYSMADQFLNRQAQERLNAALNTLIAAAEVGSEGVEWDPKERHLNVEAHAFVEPVVWLVSNHRGDVIDCSRVENTAAFQAAVSDNAGSVKIRPDFRIGIWLVGQRDIQTAANDRTIDPTPADSTDDELKYPEISITAGVSLDPVGIALRQFAIQLLGISLGIWFVALLLGRIVCRRALLPVTRMSQAAGEIDASDLAVRLPNIASHDELEDLNGSFNRLLDRLQDTLERQKRFTGDASHQLRTPLTAILGQIEVTLRRERSLEEYRQVLVKVQNQSDHLARLVESLLFLARADSESGIPDLEPLKLSTWIPQYLETWSHHARSSDLGFHCNSSLPCVVKSHPELMSELLTILIDNACKYSKSGTPIRVRLEQHDYAVWVKVEDEGCGIAKQDLGNLFVPFFRTDETRRSGIEGVGLGLSIAKRLAKAFDADLSVVSGARQGCTFSLIFPCCESNDPLLI